MRLDTATAKSIEYDRWGLTTPAVDGPNDVDSMLGHLAKNIENDWKSTFVHEIVIQQEWFFDEEPEWVAYAVMHLKAAGTAPPETAAPIRLPPEPTLKARHGCFRIKAHSKEHRTKLRKLLATVAHEFESRESPVGVHEIVMDTELVDGKRVRDIQDEWFAQVSLELEKRGMPDEGSSSP